MQALDTIIIATYLAGLFFVSLAVSSKEGIDSFFVNKRKTRLLLLILTIVSTNVGAGFFMSVAAEAYSSGIGFGCVIILVAISTCLVLAFFAPRIKAFADARNIYTLPQFLGTFYASRHVLLVSAGIVLFGYFFVTALQFVGIAAVGSVITGFDLRQLLIGAGFVTVLYTAIGGIRSNIYVDAISFAITALALIFLVPRILSSGRVDLSTLPNSYWDPFSFGGPAFFVLSIILSVVGAFLFMELWQRIFAAESVQTARKAFLLSAVVQVPFILAGLLLGLVGATMFPGAEKSTIIFRVFMEFLPTGLLGIGLVAVLAILMDTVNALVVVGGSTLLNDVYGSFRPLTDPKRMLLLARAFTLGFGFISLLTAALLPDLVKLLLMGAFVMMPMGPAIIGALLWKRGTAAAATVSMLLGFVTTIVLIKTMPQTAFAPGFAVSAIVYLAMSLLSKRHSTNL